MSVSILLSLRRRIVCSVLLAAVPASLLGQAPAAILHSQGGVWVNGYEARDASSVFAGDLLETKTGFSASLSLEGSTVLIQPESVAKFQGDLLVLEHGSVSVGTSKSFKVRVNCLMVVPVANDWTQYEVTDVNRTVQVVARKLDVKIEQDLGTGKPSPQAEGLSESVVHEGEVKSLNESTVCGAPPQPLGPATSLNPKWIAIGAGGAGGLLCILLCRPAPTKPHVSPANF